jgi:hypothetical protein
MESKCPDYIVSTRGIRGEGSRFVVEDVEIFSDSNPSIHCMTLKPRTTKVASDRKTRKDLLVNWIYLFVSITVDEAFPLICLSREAGLGLSEVTIGKILSGSGLIFACCQYFVYAWTVNRYGLQGSIQIGTILSGPIIALVPIALSLNQGGVENSLTWSAPLTASLAWFSSPALQLQPIATSLRRIEEQ